MGPRGYASSVAMANATEQAAKLLASPLSFVYYPLYSQESKAKHSTNPTGSTHDHAAKLLVSLLFPFPDCFCTQKIFNGTYPYRKSCQLPVKIFFKMSDLDLGTLINTMGNILLAILIFALGMVPTAALALFSAWLACAKERTHFFERKMPRHDTFLAFALLFGLAHVFTTFLMAMIWGVEGGASALTVVTYSVASVVTVTLGLSLGAFMLVGLWVGANDRTPS